MTKICVIGGGPAGMYTSKNLLDYNFKVTLYEKARLFSFFNKVVSPFTSYNFNYFKDTLLHKNFRLQLGRKTDIGNIKHKYDAFVVATGAPKPKELAIKGKEHCIQAVDIAKNYTNNKIKFGKDVLVVGSGNVAMDIVRYLFTKPNVQTIALLARKGPFHLSCSNTALRNILDIKDIEVTYNLDVKMEHSKVDKSAQNNRRFTILERETQGKKNLNMHFYTNIEKIEKQNEKLQATLKGKDTMYKSNFDTVITAIGFKKPVIRSKTSKPVFLVGWCKNPVGSLNDIKNDAFFVANKIKKFFSNV